MATLETQVDRLLALTAETDADAQALSTCLQELVEASRDATPDARNTALSRMAVALNHPNPQIGGNVAIVGGALVEQGASPQVWFSALLPHLQDTLQAAVPFVEACEAVLPPEDMEEETGEEEYEEEDYDEDEAEFEDEEYDEEAYEEEEEEAAGLWLGDRMVPGELVEEIIRAHGKGFLAYEALETWCLPAITCLALSPELRAEARTHSDLLEKASLLARVNGQAGFLQKMLQVLDDEPLLVLHPELKKGFRCRIGGIGDNFQLHTLLADTLISAPRGGMLGRLFGKREEGTEEGLPGTRPHPVIAAVARGEGAQTASIQSSGVWNLYAWKAWSGSGKLPLTEDTQSWVWGEGIPADIPLFEGVRVLLLGSPAYPRTWNTARLFNRMKAYVNIEERLSPQDVEAWLRRLAAAAS